MVAHRQEDPAHLLSAMGVNAFTGSSLTDSLFGARSHSDRMLLPVAGAWGNARRRHAAPLSILATHGALDPSMKCHACMRAGCLGLEHARPHSCSLWDTHDVLFPSGWLQLEAYLRAQLPA